MGHPINILLLSKDPTLFEQNDAVIGDTRKRHIAYSNILQSRYPGSQIKVITYTKRTSLLQHEKINQSLSIFGTASAHRITYLAGVIRMLPKTLEDGWRPDIVTAQTPWEEGIVGYVISRIFNAKFILQIHFDLFSEHWRKENRFNLWRNLIARALIKRSDAVRVVSEFQKHQLVDCLGKPSGTIRVIPVGVNFQPLDGEKSAFKRKIAISLEAKKVVLFVGKFYAPKNLQLWIDVAQLISRDNPDVMFVMAGNGPMFGEIREAVINRGLSDRFIFLGYVKHEELPGIYAAADVFLLTSYYEGFGRVVLEAYLAKIPVVSTKCAGTLDLIESGVTGILAPVGDAQTLADGVINLLSADELRMSYGTKGHARVNVKYGFANLSNKLVDFWGSVCDEST
ncbi:MAG: glycosyltransferase family 4 protein [Gammaproteobacteria bacterium]|nr:glycosyltransferase family 4 protein [Gammaproteobacteria bacterium]